MKNIFSSLLVFFICIGASAQNCFWAQRAGNTGGDQSHHLATDASGNVFVTGDFTGTITFGSTTLTDPGSGGNFLVKYSPSGVVLWAQLLNGWGNGLTTDSGGNVFVTGYYNGTKTFGSTTLISTGFEDIFVAKVNASGTVLWAKSAGGISNIDEGTRLARGGGDNLFLTGYFRSDSAKFGTTTLYRNSVNLPDMFVAKYSASTGNIIWAKGAGGNRYDLGNGVTSDAAQNVYVSGSFSSDSVKFGSTPTLISGAAGATHMFLVKYDSLGTVQWSRKAEGLWGDVSAYELANDGSSLYTIGEFQGVSVKFGGDSLINHSSGSTDVFLAKYSFGGVAVWGRSCGGTNYDYGKNLSIDTGGKIYIAGNFTSGNFAFGIDTTLVNASSSSHDIFIGKYDGAGVFDWAQRVGNSGTETARGISAGPAPDVYFTGHFNGLSVPFGSTTISSAGGNDIFVADMFPFSSGISSVTNVSCNSGSDGSASVIATGGHATYSYLWNSSPPQSTATATGLPAGSYNVVVTEGYGCSLTSSVNITEPPADAATICLVTVDSLSQNNVIIWDKTSFTTVDSFRIYREITTGNYSPIGSVSFDSLSQFIDTVRFLYFPNTGNPNNGTYRYKIEALSTCGMPGPMSPYHNTIFISNSGGTFTWPQLYEIEGSANPVSNYTLMRDDSTNGNWQAVASVAGTQQIINDPNYSTYQFTASWRVETVWSISCTPTRTFSTSYSNVVSNVTTAISEENVTSFLTLCPNPVSDKLMIDYGKNECEVEILNLLGEVVLRDQVRGQKKVDVSGLPAGAYFVRTPGGRGGKFIKQ